MIHHKGNVVTWKNDKKNNIHNFRRVAIKILKILEGGTHSRSIPFKERLEKSSSPFKSIICTNCKQIAPLPPRQTRTNRCLKVAYYNMPDKLLHYYFFGGESMEKCGI